MKTSNKLLTAVVVLAAAPLLCTSVAEYFRTTPLRELLGRIDRTPVRVVDARGLRLDADSLAGPTTPRLLLEGLPQAGEVALCGDTLVLRSEAVRSVCVAEAEVLLLDGRTIRRPFGTKEAAIRYRRP